MFISSYILAGFGGWIAAQGIKIALDRKSRQLNSRKLANLYRSGGMPSAHAASMVAVTTLIGLVDGLNSGLFGLSLLLTLIIIYDAVMVRRSSGLQGEMLVKLASVIDKKAKAPAFAKGHNPLDVVVGSLIGLFVGYVVFLATI